MGTNGRPHPKGQSWGKPGKGISDSGKGNDGCLAQLARGLVPVVVAVIKHHRGKR